MRTLFTLVVAVFLLAFSGCSRGTQLESKFNALTAAVQAYCNTPPIRRSSQVRSDLLDRLNAFEAELASQPAETRLRYRDRLMNQRCFVEMAR